MFPQAQRVIATSVKAFLGNSPEIPHPWQGNGNKAIKKGGLKRADQLQVTIGQAYMELHEYDKATKAFEQARKDKRSKSSAENWIRFSASEKKRWKLYNQS